MAEVKLVVAYPRPRDISDFERSYLNEHMPMARAKLSGVTKIVLTRIVDSADGSIPPFHRIAEIYFPSMEALQTCVATEGAKQTVAHAISISNGGPPLFMIAESETITVDARAVA